jgi:hypothetical protein
MSSQGFGDKKINNIPYVVRFAMLGLVWAILAGH